MAVLICQYILLKVTNASECISEPQNIPPGRPNQRQDTKHGINWVNVKIILVNSPRVFLDWSRISRAIAGEILRKISYVKFKTIPPLFLVHKKHPFCLQFWKNSKTQ